MYKQIDDSDKVTRTTFLNQLVDVIQEDISGSATRRAYQVFVTGGVGPGVTSSMFQTVYDQDFTLQTANPIFDITVGLSKISGVVTSSQTRVDARTNKYFFPSTSLMMREKMDIYRQYAATLLGNPNAYFITPLGSNGSAGNRQTNYPEDTPTRRGVAIANTARPETEKNHDRIDEALFFNFRRLFTRDGIKRETFAMRLFKSASMTRVSANLKQANLNKTSELGQDVVTDIGSLNSQVRLFGGEVGELVFASDTTKKVGLIFYDAGTVILDAKKVFSASQAISGTIAAMNNNSYAAGTASPALAKGFTVIGGKKARGRKGAGGNGNAAKFIPDLWSSASIDDLVDHICASRFSSGTLTSATFQNVTNITSTLVFCRAAPDQFNYSSNPTFRDPTTGRITVIDPGANDQRSFTFPTTIGLYDNNRNLLAVAKLSRPIEKNDEKDLTFRIRLDF